MVRAHLVRGWTIVVAALCAIFLSTLYGQESDDKLLKEDAASVQGKWSTKTPTPQGKTFESRKEVSGKNETVSVFENDQLVYEHKNDFEVSRSGRVKLFTYSNLEVTAGPAKGAKPGITRSYVYRVAKDPMGKTYLLEVHGVLTGGEEEKEPVNVIVWERVNE